MGLDCVGEEPGCGGPPREDAAAGAGFGGGVEDFGGREVVDSGPEEGFHGRSEVEGYGLRGEGPDTCGGGTGCGNAAAVGSREGRIVGRDGGEDAFELGWIIDGHVGRVVPS